MSVTDKRKVLTIKHDGKLYVSGYGSLQLGDRPLSDIVAEAIEKAPVGYPTGVLHACV